MAAAARLLRASLARTSARPQSSRAFSGSAVLPSSARVVIVGGGIVGTAVAYHLAKLGWGDDVLLLERDRLTSGTTWHAAGLVQAMGSISESATEIRKYTKKLYSELEAETGQPTGFMPVGFLVTATERERLEEWRRIAAFNRHCGVDVHEIGPSQVRELWPLARVDDVLAGFYCEDDGRVNPVDATMALAKGARMNGVRICEGVSVAGVSRERGRVTGVTTTAGDTIHAEFVVNCAGMWARQLGELAGVSIPLQAAEHYYLITDEIPEVDASWPILEDPSSFAYYRKEGGGLMVGLFEGDAAAWGVGGVPHDFSFGSLEPNWERLAPFLEKAFRRVPAAANVGVKTLFCGPESFTPDLEPIFGEVPELSNFFVCAGMCSRGILSGPGMARLLAHWIVHGSPDMDVTSFNIDRLHPYQTNPQYREHRVVETLARVYECHLPNAPTRTARNVKQSPVHERLVARGAYFRDVSGWEGADWYAGAGVTPHVETLSWGRESWFSRWAEEHRTCREQVGLIDYSFLSKLLVQGPDAGRLLNRLSTANVDGAAGSITYTQWLNEAGRMEADLTVLKQAKDRFMVIANDTAHRHVLTMIERAIHAGARAPARSAAGAGGAPLFATVADVTSAFALFNLQGPRARDLMQRLTTEDMSHHAFPFGASRDIDCGYGRVIASRITYVGELGWELLVPSEMARHVYDRIMEAGEGSDLGLSPVGLKALGSLRMEKGYRDFGHDMDNTDSLLEVGLGFTCDFQKEGGFIGQEAVQRERDAGVKALRQRLVQVLLLDPQPLMFHGEIVYRNGQRVGDVRSASFGHTLGGAVGLAMVSSGGEPITKQWIESGDWEIDVAGVRHAAKASLRPLYDPSNARIRM